MRKHGDERQRRGWARIGSGATGELSTDRRLEKICRGLRQVQRADGRPTEDDSPERFVRLRYRGDGTVSVEAVLLPDEAHRVMDALRLARAAMREEQASEVEGAQPELADALTRIAEDILAGDAPANDSPGNDDLANDGLGRATETDRRSRGSDGAPLDSTSSEAGPRSSGNDGPVNDGPEPASEADRRSLGNGAPLDSTPSEAGPRSSANAAAPLDSTRTDADPRSLGNGAPLDSTPSETGPRFLGNADTRLDSTSDAGPRSLGNAVRRPRAACSSGAERAQVIVHFTEDRIDGGHAAFLDDGSRVAPETFRRLACDCGLIGVREDQDGDPLDAGRKTRTIPPALRRAVMLRDEHCQFPGCTHDRHIDLHHIVHWVHGGPTSKQNLIALCTFHHTLVHEGGFTLERSEGGLRFLAPDRAHLPSVHAPPPAPTDPLEAFERAHADLRIHDETGLTGWDGERVHYDDVVEVLAAADEPGAAVELGHAEQPGADRPGADQPGADRPGADQSRADQPRGDQPGAEHPGDLDLPVRTWLAKHGLDA